jgi:hypothetical protein
VHRQPCDLIDDDGTTREYTSPSGVAAFIAVIRSGSVLGRPPIASMPHWGGIISNQDLEALVAYLKTLK